MLGKVICKFTVQSVEQQFGKKRNPETDEYDVPYVSGIKVNLAPVYAPKDAKCENAKFWEATPQGQLWMQINNPAAFEFFEKGGDLYLTLEKV
jgi:hypothetical protein